MFWESFKRSSLHFVMAVACWLGVKSRKIYPVLVSLGATQQCLLSPSSCRKRDMILVWVIGVERVLKIQNSFLFYFSMKISKCGFITPGKRNGYLHTVSLYIMPSMFDISWLGLTYWVPVIHRHFVKVGAIRGNLTSLLVYTWVI